MNILKFNHKALRTKCEPVTDFTDVASILVEMQETMLKNNGVGLAAPQVGITKRMIVVQDYLIVNPEIVEMKGSEIGVEGCLSYPGLYRKIRRPTWIKTKYQDCMGQHYEREFTDLQARIFCHEVDHLNGKCRVAKK